MIGPAGPQRPDKEVKRFKVKAEAAELRWRVETRRSDVLYGFRRPEPQCAHRSGGLGAGTRSYGGSALRINSLYSKGRRASYFLEQPSGRRSLQASDAQIGEMKRVFNRWKVAGMSSVAALTEPLLHSLVIYLPCLNQYLLIIPLRFLTTILT